MLARILIINDAQEILQLYHDILTAAGYEALIHAYAVQDLDHVRSVAPDLVIVDCAFGREQAGWQLVQKIKMCADTARLPVLVCTASPELVRGLGDRLEAKGVSVLFKPFEGAELTALVGGILRSRPLASRNGHTREAGR